MNFEQEDTDRKILGIGRINSAKGYFISTSYEQRAN